MNGLITSLNTNNLEKRSQIRDLIVGVWDEYDSNNDGVVCKEEFLEEDGLEKMLINLEE